MAGERPDGTIFFYIKNISPGSPDYAPPGTIYEEEPSQEYVAAARRGDTLVNGPIKDRRGTWFAAQTPIINARTGQPICTFGADIAAADWYAKIIYHVMPCLIANLLLALVISLSPLLDVHIWSGYILFRKYPGPWPSVLAY